MNKIVYIKNRPWKLIRDIPNWHLWNADYYTSDGDGIELYISKDKDRLELSCFSGMGATKIIIYDIDFQYLSNNIEIDFKESFEHQCLQIGDYFCRILCEYNNKEMSFGEEIETYVIPGINRMIKKEKEHLLFLESHKYKSNKTIVEFINKSKEMLDHLEKRKNEYIEYLKNS